jgi:hypothetical protein
VDDTAVFDFTVRTGATFNEVFLWGTDAWVSKPITGMSKAAPVVVTAVAHGVPDGWPVAIVAAGGATGLNAATYPPRGRDWHSATVLTTSTIQLTDASTAAMAAYTSGGFLIYPEPVDLSSITQATLTIRDAPETGTTLLALTSDPSAGVVLDNTGKTITATFQTTGLTWVIGYYDLTCEDTTGTKTQIATGTITIA